MDELHLDVETVNYNGDDILLDLIVYTINGRSLAQLVAEIEHQQKYPLAKPGYKPSTSCYVGVYFPVICDAISTQRNQSARELGEIMEDGWTTLLMCGCGTLGCWDFVARITVEDDRVVWSNFSIRYHEHMRFDALEPLVFDRQQYEGEIERVLSEYAQR